MKQTLRIVLICLTLPFSGSKPALAASIINLSSQSQLIEVKEKGGFKPFLLESGRSFRIVGPATFRYNGSEIYIDFDEEYAIWKDGEMGVQRRHLPHSFRP